MKKAIFMIAILLFLSASTSNYAVAGEILQVKSKDKTSANIPLKFTFEKTKWDGDDIWVWGTISNQTNKTYKSVYVIFTARGHSGKFIGRKTCRAKPPEIAPGQVGYIEKRYIDCEGRKPISIEFMVIND